MDGVVPVSVSVQEKAADGWRLHIMEPETPVPSFWWLRIVTGSAKP